MRVEGAIALVIAAVFAATLGRGGDAGAAPSAGCAPKQVRAALVSFTRAYNAGDDAKLDALFADEPRFQWYSTDAPGERLNPEAKRRKTLIPYFEARHRRHDRFKLRSFQFNGNSSRWGNFQIWMRRRADGFNGGDSFRAFGKGAAICDGADVRFIVLTFGSAIRSRARS
jgi:hypothetical protein